MHEEARAAIEYGVVLVFPAHGIAAASAFLEASDITAEIPAPWFLAQISPDGSLLAI